MNRHLSEWDTSIHTWQLLLLSAIRATVYYINSVTAAKKELLTQYLCALCDVLSMPHLYTINNISYTVMIIIIIVLLIYNDCGNYLTVYFRIQCLVGLTSSHYGIGM